MVPGVAGSVLAEARTAPGVRFWSVYLTGERTQRRRHSTIGQISPAEYERRTQAT